MDHPGVRLPSTPKTRHLLNCPAFPASGGLKRPLIMELLMPFPPAADTLRPQ